jgi:hypothetical protein
MMLVKRSERPQHNPFKAHGLQEAAEADEEVVEVVEAEVVEEDQVEHENETTGISYVMVLWREASFQIYLHSLPQ